MFQRKKTVLTVISLSIWISVISIFLLNCQSSKEQMGGFLNEQTITSVISELKKIHGDALAGRIEKGVKQVAQFWRKEDGGEKEFMNFCKEQFIAEAEVLQETADRFEYNLEMIYGHNTAIRRELHRPIDLELGPIRPVDFLFANYSPYAHLSEDCFKTKIAFAALLNFPLYSLEERLELGNNWTREQWAQVRLVQEFATRVPATVQQEITKAFVAADHYISNYNIYMHNLLASDDERLFPKGLKLISHWGLRDELKAQYANADGLRRQQMIHKVMERIILQEIPEVVIDNPDVDWNLNSNVVKNEKGDVETKFENNTRYSHLLSIFHAEKSADPYYPHLPTLIDRRFKKDREIPEDQFRELLVSVLSASMAKQVGKIISKRLGRPLQPFDVWYNGFKSRGVYQESELDKIVGEKYPHVAVFQDDLVNILKKLGFDRSTAEFLSSKIIVDPSRGAGHAMGADMREDEAHLRTRIPKEGMKYKGYNIAIHELGHNVEQVFSLNRIDHTLLQGVPNTAFTEGFAFVFQSRDLELLGLTQKDLQVEHLKALDTFWSTFEIAGVSLVDIDVWHWMYDHPSATPQELKEAVMKIAQNIWNEYFAPVFGVEDEILLAIYSHMIDAGLYLPDYPLGHIIAFQIEQFFKDKNLAVEMERMCRIGSISPEAWMEQAVGSPVSAQPLLSATGHAVKKVL